MKLYASLYCSVSFIVAVSAFSACNQAERSESVGTSVPPPTATSSPITQEENNPAAPAPKGEAYRSGDIKIVSADLEQKDKRLRYELKISYPQIHEARTPQERKFNLYVRGLVQNDLKNFRRFCWKNRKYPDGRERQQDYYFATSYDMHYATRELLSIELAEESFNGQTKFMKTIAFYCVKEFMSRGLNCGGGGVGDEEWLHRGTEPKAENYPGWHLTRDGVQITFGEYQVGPGCLVFPVSWCLMIS